MSTIDNLASLFQIGDLWQKATNILIFSMKDTFFSSIKKCDFEGEKNAFSKS